MRGKGWAAGVLSALERAELLLSSGAATSVPLSALTEVDMLEIIVLRKVNGETPLDPLGLAKKATKHRFISEDQPHPPLLIRLFSQLDRVVI